MVWLRHCNPLFIVSRRWRTDMDGMDRSVIGGPWVSVCTKCCTDLHPSMPSPSWKPMAKSWTIRYIRETLSQLVHSWNTVMYSVKVCFISAKKIDRISYLHTARKLNCYFIAVEVWVPYRWGHRRHFRRSQRFTAATDLCCWQEVW